MAIFTRRESRVELSSLILRRDCLHCRVVSLDARVRLASLRLAAPTFYLVNTSNRSISPLTISRLARQKSAERILMAISAAIVEASARPVDDKSASSPVLHSAG